MFVTLSLFYFFFYITIGLYIIYLPKIMEILLYSPMQIGIIFSTIPAVRFLLPFFFLKKLKINKIILNLSIFLGIFSSFLLIFTIDNYFLLLLTNFLLGLSITILYPYMETVTVDVLKERYGKSRLFGSLGFIFISFTASPFALRKEIILFIYFLATLFYSVFSYVVIYENKDIKKTNEGKSDLNFFKNKGFWLSIFLLQVSFGAYYNFFTIYENSQGISMKTIGYLWSFSVICEVIILYFQNYFLKRNLLKIIKFSIFVAFLRWLLIYVFPQSTIVSFISQSLHSVSFALYYSATILYMYSIYKNNRKMAMLFLSGVSYGLGGLTGALFAGFFYGENIFLYSALIALLALFVLYLDD